MAKKVIVNPTAQYLDTHQPDRSMHIWVRRGDEWKCVLCGGITSQPSDNGGCDRYEKLTDEERALAPYKPS